jgi:MFS family permease
MTWAVSRSRKFNSSTPVILFLLIISAFINYIDRGSLSIAAPLIKDELNISAAQLGVLLSSFFWTYALFQIVLGSILERLDVHWVFAAGFLLWSLATAGAGIAHSFVALLAMRTILGIGESAAYPCYSQILATRLPEERRGRANSLIAAAAAAGPAFGVFAGGLLMSRIGWRMFFMAFGVASLAWLVPWIHASPRKFTARSAFNNPAPTLLDLLRRRSVLGTCVGLFCVNYVSYFLLTWLPFYLVRERHFSMKGMATVSGTSYMISALMAATAGWLSDHLIAKGGSPTVIRKSIVAIGLTFAGIFLLACVRAQTRNSIFLLWIGSASYGACASNVWAITQTLAGRYAAGKWTGLQNVIGNLAGIAAPAITGFVVDRTGRFTFAFVITSAFAMLGAGVWCLVVGPIQTLKWEATAGPTKKARCRCQSLAEAANES